MIKRPIIVRTKTIIGIIQIGFMTPQLQIQITPLSWGLSFVWVTTNKIPNKFGFKVGPVALVLYVGPGRFEIERTFENTPSVTFKDAG